MLKEKKISLSIFYSKSSWTLLIKELIIPLLKSLREGRLVKNFFIMYNMSISEFIELELQSNELSRKPAFRKKLLKDINRFLKNHPSHTHPIQFPLRDSFFKPFPNNSVVIGHFVNSLPNIPNKPFEETKYFLSKVILDALIAEEVNEETIYSLIMYIQLASFYAFLPDLIKSKELARDFLQILSREDVSEFFELTDYESFESYLSSNKDTIREIIEDIWSGQDHPAWLKSWIDYNKELKNQCKDGVEVKLLHINMVLFHAFGFYDKNFTVVCSIMLKNTLLSASNDNSAIGARCL
nr:hypothetical protein [uncultured Pedobacter sp.]